MSLSTLEIAQLRADQTDYHPDTCILQTLTRTLDSVGGWSETWANTYTSVACRMAPLQMNRPETIDGAQMASTTRWILSVAHNQALDAIMRCVHDSTTYEIEHVEDTHSNRTARRAYLRRVD
ncbi:MAG TPA: head-tail adaptor protein [Anaerolineae bacterium]|nr:head-tail adaptor protein [Anaerolineae bacterium]